MNFPVDSWLEACGWGLGSLACASALLIVVLLRRKQKHVADKHVLITGGSEGLGLELAKECVRRGARRVTIVGRREGKLREAVRSLEMTRDNFYEKEMGVTRKSDKGPLCTVSHFSVDCCDETAVKKLFSQLESEGDSPQVVVCNVGAAVARLFGDLQASDFRRMMEVNFLSSVYVAQSAVPLMKKAGGGMLMFVSSQAGQVAVGGYSAYSASKFALRGFSEVLQMELEPLGIQVSTVYPPSIDTPGYVEEQKGKPSLTQQIEADSGLWSADTVARVSVQGFESGEVRIGMGFEGGMLKLLTAGMGPVNSGLALLFEVFSMSVLRLVAAGYLWYYGRLATASAKAQTELGLDSGNKLTKKDG